MAKTWGELSQLPEFQSLSREEQERARGLFFDTKIAPQVAPEVLGKARSMYDEKTLSRTWGEALSDTGKQVVEGGINIANAIPSLIAPNSDVVKYLDESATGWREAQSPTMKAKSANAEAAVEQAGKEGFWAQTGEALSQYGTDPALASRLVATNIASLIPGLGSAKAAQVASLARSAKAAEAAGVALNTTEAAQRAAKMAMIAGGTTNAALNAGGARGEAYQDIYKTLMETGDYDEAQAEQIALGQSALPAAVGAATGALSGSTGLERALLGPALRSGGLKAFAAGTGKELGTEMLEEGAPKVTTNLQAGEYDQRPWSQDLGDTLVQTVIGAGPTSLAAGAASAMRAPVAAPSADPGVTPPVAPPIPPEDSTAPDVASTPPEPSFAGLAPEQQQQALQNVAAGKPWDEGLGISDAEIVPPAAPAPAPIPVVGALSAAANAGQQAEAAGISSSPAPTAEQQAAQQQAQVKQQQAQLKQETAAAKDQAALQSAQLKLQQQQQAAAQQQQQAALKTKQAQLKINQSEQKLGLGPTQFDEPTLLNQASTLAALSQPTIDQPTPENAHGLQAQTDAQVPSQVPEQAPHAALVPAPAGEVALATTQEPAAATGQTSAPGVAPGTAPLAGSLAPEGPAPAPGAPTTGALPGATAPLATTQAPAAASGQTSAPAEGAFPGEAPLATTQAPAAATGQTSAPGAAPLSNTTAPAEEQTHVDAFNQVNQRINSSKKEAAPRALVRLATEADLPAAGRGARRLAGAIASAFGHRVIYIASADAKTPLSFDGSVSPTDPTRILIANDAEAPVTRVVAHEVLHGLKRVAPEVYDNMLGSLRQLYDPQKVARHAKQRGYQGGLNESNEEEWVADFFSNTLHEPKSLAQVALAMDLKKTGAGLEFLNNLKEFIGRIIAKLRGDAVIGQGFAGADEAVKDLEQARAAVVKATAEYARARLTGKTAESLGAAPLSARLTEEEKAARAEDKTKAAAARAKAKNPPLETGNEVTDIYARTTVSARAPTSPGAKENPVTHDLGLDLNTYLKAPSLLPKVVATLSTYPQLRPAKGEATDAQRLRSFIEVIRANLLWLHDQVDPEIRKRSKLWYDGALKITERAAARYGVTKRQFAAVLATQSPQKDWFENVSLGERITAIFKRYQDHTWDAKMDVASERVLKQEELAELADDLNEETSGVDATPSKFLETTARAIVAKSQGKVPYPRALEIAKEAQAKKNAVNRERLDRVRGKRLAELYDDLDAAIWVRVFDAAHHSPHYHTVSPEGNFVGIRQAAMGPARIRWGTFAAVAKSISVLKDGTIENISTQLGKEHKIRNFYNNIIVPNDPRGYVTMDTHAIAADMVSPFSGYSIPVSHNFGSRGAPGSTVYGISGTYPIHGEGYTRAAKARELLPREMQSITWEAIRGVFPAQFKRKPNIDHINALWQDYNEGKTSLEKTREAILDYVIEKTGRTKEQIFTPEWARSPAESLSEVSYEDKPGMPPVSTAQHRAGSGMNVEVAPNPDLLKGAAKGAAAKWGELTAEERRKVTEVVGQPIIKQVMAKLGIKQYRPEFTVGGYETEANPSITIHFGDAVSWEQLEEATRVLGYLWKQKEMVMFDETDKTTDDQVTFIRVKPSRQLSVEELSDLYVSTHAAFPAAGGMSVSDGAPVFANFSDLTDEEFEKGLSNALQGYLADKDYSAEAGVTKFRSALIGDVVGQDKKTGDDIVQTTLRGTRYDEETQTTGTGGKDGWRTNGKTAWAGGEDLRWQRDFDAIQTSFDQRFQREVGHAYRRVVKQRNAAPLSLRSDATRDERAGAGPAAQGRPSYGTARPGAVKSTGVHYSQAERQTLDSTKYGTGIKGEEGRRVAAAADQRLRQRVYFYVSTGTGVRPEPGVGGYTHTVDLNNLYDLDADPQYLYRPDLATNDERMNAFESAVIDAGFDGYVADFAGQRAAVLVGPHQVPVRYEGLAQRPAVPAGERATPNPLKQVAALLRTPWMRQTPKAFGERLKAADPDLYRQFGDQLTATDQTYWPGDMVKQLVPPDTVNATPADVASWSRAAPLSLRTKPAPKKTVKAYKLFRVHKDRPGELFPLFVDMEEGKVVPTRRLDPNRHGPSIPIGSWQDAEEGQPSADTKTGKPQVKSSLGDLAYRPGFHAGDLPIATHIGGDKMSRFDEESGTMKELPTSRPPDQVWAEVEYGADVDWQAEANNRAERYKSSNPKTGAVKGEIVPKTAAITDQIPVDGFYRYKTNPNMTGNWLIGGTMKILRILSDAEVKQINDAAGVADLPRKEPLDLKKLGFDDSPRLVFSNRATVQEENLTKREYGAVIRKFTNSDGSRKEGWLKAPNGRPSNLDNRQWVQVRTPSFIKWFGPWQEYAGQPGGVWNDDAGKVSKIVDENGEPQVVYHGSKKAGFTVLDPAEGDKHRSAMVFTAKTNDTAATYAGTKDEAEMPAAPASDAAPTQASLEARGYEFVREEDPTRGRGVWWSVNDPDGNVVDSDNYDDLAGAIDLAAAHYSQWGDDYDQETNEKPGIYPLFLNIRNPYESHFGGANWDGQRLGGDSFSIWDSENEEYVDGSDYEPLTESEAREKYEELGGDEVEYDGRPRYDIQEAPDLGETTNSVAETALYMGSDGAIIQQVVDDGGQGLRYYVANPDDVMVFFNANQAKSATQNTGEFSASNDDLRFSLRPTLKVDGVERPTTNSLGQPLHATEDGVRNFWRWFGSSRVVDAEGRPRVVYHGTTRDFTAFDPDAKTAWHADFLGRGIYATPSKSDADFYAKTEEGSNVLPIYMKVERPLILENRRQLRAFLKSRFPEGEAAKIIERSANTPFAGVTGALGSLGIAIRQDLTSLGYDSVVTRSIENPDEIVVFKPTQVKSAVGNRGTFDSENPDLRFSNRPTPNDPPEETRFRKAQRVVQDKFNRFRVIQDWLRTQGVKLSDAGDVYRAEERFHARVANQIEDFREQTLKPLVAKSQKAGVKMADIAQFLHAQHAEERNDAIAKINPKFPDGGSGMATQEARTILAAASPELKQIANEWRKIADDSLELKLQAGLITQEQADAFRSKYHSYVPLRGGPEEQLLVGTGKGLKVRHKEQRALGHPVREGGEWIIEQLLADRESAIMKAEKALIAKHVLQMAVEMQRPDIISVEQPKLRQVLKNQVSYVVTYRGSPIDAFQTLEAARVFRQMAGSQKGNHLIDFDIVRSSDPQVVLMASPRLGDNEMMAYVGGHEIRIQLNDDLLARAYANLGQDALGPILRAGRVLNTWLSKVYTGYNPEFILVNLMRDFTTGIANLSGEQGARMAMRAVKRYPKAFRDLLRYARNPARATQSIKDYREDGGNTGAAYLDDLERIGTDVAAEYAKLQGVIGNLRERNARGAASSAIGQTLKPLISWIEKLNQAGENAMRLAIYQAMRDAGKGRVAAASAAKNTTVNFNRKGELGLALNAWWLFFNAAVQGTSSIAHAHFKGATKGQAWAFSSGLIGTAYLASLLAAGDDEEDDEYEKISEYDRSRNLIIRTQDGFVKLPIPYGYGFFANLGRGLADAQRTGEVGKLPWHLATSFIEEFTPFGAMVAGKQPDWQQAMTFMGPTAWQIGAVPAYNRTSFGTPLYPEQAFKTEEFARDQMWRGTKGTWADELAGALEQAGMDVSPETLKHLWRTGTGGAGTFATGILDAAQLKARGADDLDAREVPLLRKFLAVPGVQEARARYYEAVEEAKIAKETFARFKKQGRFEEMETYQGKNEARISMAKVAETTAKRIKAARNRYDEVKLDPDLPLPEKRRQLREMEREETQIYDDFVRMFQERTRVAPR